MDKDTVVHMFCLLPIRATAYALRAYCIVQDGTASTIGIICYRENKFNVQSIGQDIFSIRLTLGTWLSMSLFVQQISVLLRIFLLATDVATAIFSI